MEFERRDRSTHHQNKRWPAGVEPIEMVRRWKKDLNWRFGRQLVHLRYRRGKRLYIRIGIILSIDSFIYSLRYSNQTLWQFIHNNNNIIISYSFYSPPSMLSFYLPFRSLFLALMNGILLIKLFKSYRPIKPTNWLQLLPSRPTSNRRKPNPTNNPNQPTKQARSTPSELSLLLFFDVFLTTIYL